MRECTEFKLKISDRKKSFLYCFDNQIDQSSLPDFVLHRLRKSPKKGLKTPLTLISSLSVTGVDVNFYLPFMMINFWSCFSFQISL